MQDMTFKTWRAERSARVLDYMREQISRRSASVRQSDLLNKTIALSNCGTLPEYYQAPMHLPLLAYWGVVGEDEPAIPVAAVCAMLWIGAELYDNLTDGDLPKGWREHREFEIVFAATAISCVLPPAILVDLDVPAGRRKRMQTFLSDVLLKMFAGQERDLAFTDSTDVSAKAVEVSVVGKNGEPKAFFTGLGAMMAGASAKQVRAYLGFGQAFGVVYQLQSDFYEMFKAPVCPDLVQGTRTLQIAMCLEQLCGKERTRLLALLDAARTDEDAQQEVRDLLRQAKFIRPWMQVVTRYTEQAKAALAAAAPKEPAREILMNLLTARSPKC